MSTIQVSGSIRPKITNTVLDERSRVATITDISNIQNPAVGLLFYVIDTGKLFKVTQLDQNEELITGYVEITDAAVIASVQVQLQQIQQSIPHNISELQGVENYATQTQVADAVSAASTSAASALETVRSKLQQQIDGIILDKVTVGASASPSLVYIGEAKTITITGTLSVAGDITITGGNLNVPATGTGTTLSVTDVIVPSGNTTYTVSGTVLGTTKTKNATVTAVRRIYYGSGAAYTDATTVASIRTSPAGTYTVECATENIYIFWVVPSSMSISGATMGGFDFPLEAPQSVTIDGNSYKSYRSSNAVDAGTYSITIR